MLLTTELDKLSGTDWQLFFAQERAKPYFAELDAFVTAAAAEKTVYPAAENIFAAFRACPVSAVRVVILGQDPYHEARQGVLLLNTVLTVEQGAANAHAGRGWEMFTRAALEYAAAHGTAPLAAVLWGKPAQKYAPIFNRAAAHRPVLVLESAHPSPLSAYRGFFGSAPFGKVNAFLKNNGAAEIDWRLPANATHG